MLFRCYPLVVILQVICVIHAYKSHANQKWYWIVIFFPFIGSILYLYAHFYNRRNVSAIKEGVKTVVIKDYELDKLEKEVGFADTMQNKTNLANKYVDLGRYEDAINFYESCLKGFNKENPEIYLKLVTAYFLNENYEKTIYYGEKLNGNSDFSDSREKVFYAWSLYKNNKIDLAEEKFKEMDNSYSNYPHRLEYMKFLVDCGKIGEAKKLIETLQSEFEHMKPHERKLKREIHRTIKQEFNRINQLKEA